MIPEILLQRVETRISVKNRFWSLVRNIATAQQLNSSHIQITVLCYIFIQTFFVLLAVAWLSTLGLWIIEYMSTTVKLLNVHCLSRISQCCTSVVWKNHIDATWIIEMLIVLCDFWIHSYYQVVLRRLRAL